MLKSYNRTQLFSNHRILVHARLVEISNILVNSEDDFPSYITELINDALRLVEVLLEDRNTKNIKRQRYIIDNIITELFYVLSFKRTSEFDDFTVLKQPTLLTNIRSNGGMNLPSEQPGIYGRPNRNIQSYGGYVNINSRQSFKKNQLLDTYNDLKKELNQLRADLDTTCSYMDDSLDSSSIYVDNTCSTFDYNKSKSYARTNRDDSLNLTTKSSSFSSIHKQPSLSKEKKINIKSKSEKLDEIRNRTHFEGTPLKPEKVKYMDFETELRQSIARFKEPEHVITIKTRKSNVFDTSKVDKEVPNANSHQAIPKKKKVVKKKKKSKLSPT